MITVDSGSISMQLIRWQSSADETGDQSIPMRIKRSIFRYKGIFLPLAEHADLLLTDITFTPSNPITSRYLTR